MKIQVKYGYTKNLGNYESERLDIGIERDLDENEDIKIAFTSEFAQCKKFIRTALNLDYEPNKETEQEIKEALTRRGRRHNVIGT